jgi:multimeric flavodoxin WrbA
MIQAKRPVRVAVVYYSATGNVHALARAVSEGAAREGAEVRLRHVAELNQEMLISVNQYWGRHRSETRINPKRGWRTSTGPTASPSERPPALATSPRS